MACGWPLAEEIYTAGAVLGSALDVCCSMTSHRIGRSKVPARFGYEWASGRYYTNSLGVNLVLSSMSGAELRVANNAGSDNLIIQR